MKAFRQPVSTAEIMRFASESLSCYPVTSYITIFILRSTVNCSASLKAAPMRGELTP